MSELHPLLWKTGKIKFSDGSEPRGTVIDWDPEGWLFFFTEHEQKLLFVAEDKIVHFEITGTADPTHPSWHKVRETYGLEQEG